MDPVYFVVFKILKGLNDPSPFKSWDDAWDFGKSLFGGELSLSKYPKEIETSLRKIAEECTPPLRAANRYIKKNKALLQRRELMAPKAN